MRFMPTLPELKPDYYRDNFLKLTHHARYWYGDLLHSHEHAWLTSFDALSAPAQCLLVRMLARKGRWFRTDKLNYSEIPDITVSLFELAGDQFIALPEQVELKTLAEQLLTKPEILALWPNTNRQRRKEQLVASLPDSTQIHTEALAFQPIELQHANIIRLLLVLFFANTHQDLSQFVLDDLGVHRFEAYQLSKERRFFTDREQIDQLLLLSELADAYWLCDRKNIHQLKELLSALPPKSEHPYIQRKQEHLINDIARDLERQGDWESALHWFKTTRLPPSRERRARIYDKQSQLNLLSDTVTEMYHRPLDRAEFEVAEKLSALLKRRQGNKVPRPVKPNCDEIHLNLQLDQRVELACLDHFQREGWRVYYSENTLLNGLFGLAFWSVIFAPVEGAFINAYQYRPLDLYHDDFYAKREQQIEAVFSQVESQGLNWINEVYQAKFGINNPFVQWNSLTSQLLQEAIEAIPSETVSALFRIQLSDLKLYRNGMPDLIAFKDGHYRWIEVKGPGDKLQDNQWRWIKHYQALNIPFSVCYVNH